MDGSRWSQIESLFIAAVEREAAERTTFLRRECGTDADLYSQVASLLQSYEQPDDLLTDSYFSLALQVLGSSSESLKPNQKFGDYTILNLIGRGGMGEVYLARDERLGRRIAIKLLPEFLTAYGDWRERFAREARAAAAISHPNVAHVYEVGENEGLPYIAMEYVAGETLRTRLSRERRISENEAIKIVTQIASALAAANAAGIIHRDIKPENIILRNDGYVKTLDFGIAKLGANALAENEDAGMILGTPRYMSPEQIGGKEIDGRADIWSAGVILYEMIAGEPPFDGENRQVLLKKITTDEAVNLEKAELNASAPVKEILRRALAKNPSERYASAKELEDDLRRVSNKADAIKVEAHDKSRRRLFVIALLLTAVVGVGFMFFNSARQKQNSSVAPAAAPSQITFSKLNESGNAVCAAISPDATRAAYAVEENGQQSIWIKQLNASAAPFQIVPPSPANDFAGACLAFSPDGNFLYYGVYENESLEGKLYRIPVQGGAAQFLLQQIDSPVSFSPDGAQMVYLVVKENEEKLITADADGGNQRDIIVRHRPQFLSHDGHPSWSPDGRFIAFAGGTNAGKRQMFVSLYNMANGTEKNLNAQPFYDVNQIGWLPDGSSLIAATREDGENQRRLYRVGFPNGEAARLTDDFYDYAGVSAARQANKFATVAAEDEAQIWTFDLKSGQTRQISAGKNDAQGLAWINNERIVFGSHTNNSWDLWTINADGGDTRQLTNDTPFDTDPAASADGKFIIFSSNRAGIYNLWRMNLETNELTRLTNGTGEFYPRISPDGNWAVYHRTSPGEPIAVWKVPTNGGAPVQITTKATSRADVSPDGKFVASTYRETGESNFSIGIYDLDGGKNLKILKPVSGARLFIPMRWSPDGKAIAYVVGKDGVDNLWLHPTDGKTAPRQITNFTSDRIYSFDFAPDGSKIAAARGRRHSSALLFEFLP